jgi:hypothetical protein
VVLGGGGGLVGQVPTPVGAYDLLEVKDDALSLGGSAFLSSGVADLKGGNSVALIGLP